MSQENNMPKYVCSSEERNAWQLPPEEVAKQTFNSKEDAENWFKKQYPNENLHFGGYDATIHLPTCFVSTDNNDEEIGNITEYPNS